MMKQKLWSSFRWVLQSKVILGLILGLSLNATSRASEWTCPRLFSPTSTSQNTTLGDWHLDLHEFNEPSKEFIKRLGYLIKERRMLDPQILEKVKAATEPLNPLGERATQLVFQPHQAAFAELLNKELQWDLIRKAAMELRKSADQEQKRVETASDETKAVIFPRVIRSFPFVIQKTLRTSKSQVLGIGSSPFQGNLDMQVVTHDLTTGTEISSIPVTTWFNEKLLQVAEVGDTPVAVVPQGHRLFQVDLFQKDVKVTAFPYPKDRRHAVKDEPKDYAIDFARFARASEKLGVVILQEDKVRFFNPAKEEKPKTTQLLDGDNIVVLRAGVGNDVAFVATKTGNTHVIDPSGEQPEQTLKGFTAVSAFSHNGDSYLLGVAPLDPGPWPMMKTINLRTGQESKLFGVAHYSSWPYLLETFSQDETRYGVLATSNGLYIVDLIKGEIIRQKSQNIPAGGDKLTAMWGTDHVGQVGFSFRGKFYLLARHFSEGQSVPDQLVILDALTLQPVASPLKLDGSLASIRMVPSDGKDFLLMVNYDNGTSRLVSLINEL